MNENMPIPISGEELIFLAKRKLLHDYPLYNFILLVTKITQQESTPTFSVALPRAEIYYNKTFAEKHNIDDVAFFLAHECRHVIQETYERSRSLDNGNFTKIMNIAHDYVINNELMDEGMTIPSLLNYQKTFNESGTNIGWLFADPANKISFEEYYKRILKIHETVSKKPDEVDRWLNVNDPNSEMVEYDRNYHALSSVEDRLHEKEKRDEQIFKNLDLFSNISIHLNEKKNGIFKKLFQDRIAWIDLETYAKICEFDLHFPDVTFGNENGDESENGSDGFAESDADAWAEKLKEIGQALLLMDKEKIGTLPENIKQIFNELLEPRIDVASRIKILMGQLGRKMFSTFKQPNRKNTFWGNHMIRRGKKRSQGKIWIVLDTSGSMFSETATTKKCLNAILSLAKNFGEQTHFIMSDTEIKRIMTPRELESELRRKQFSLEGFGGSDLKPTFQHIWKDSNKTKFGSTVLVFTDGFITVPDQLPRDIKSEVYWFITPNGKKPAVYGKQLKI